MKILGFFYIPLHMSAVFLILSIGNFDQFLTPPPMVVEGLGTL